MKKYVLTLFAAMTVLNALGQQMATTEDGKKVKLLPNGTWEYLGEKVEEVEETTTGETTTESINTGEPQAPVRRHTSSLYLGGKRLIAGDKTVLNSEDDDLVTSVTLAKDGDRTLIMFWQETGDDKISFFDWHWTGTVYLFLENGESIALADRNMHGLNKIPKGKRGQYDIKSDLYQRFSGHYLTLSECQKLKRSNLNRVAYRTTEEEQSTIRMNVTENNNALREQVIAIGR
jgi:hypothetical protein